MDKASTKWLLYKIFLKLGQIFIHILLVENDIYTIVWKYLR